MAEKSVDAQIADLEEQIVELKAKKALLEHPIQEYPKHIQVPDPVQPAGVPTKTIVVNSAAEEKAALTKPSDARGLTAYERAEAEKKAREEEEKAREAAKKAKR